MKNTFLNLLFAIVCLNTVVWASSPLTLAEREQISKSEVFARFHSVTSSALPEKSCLLIDKSWNGAKHADSRRHSIPLIFALNNRFYKPLIMEDSKVKDTFDNVRNAFVTKKHR
jgi:hypothetical protein